MSEQHLTPIQIMFKLYGKKAENPPDIWFKVHQMKSNTAEKPKREPQPCGYDWALIQLYRAANDAEPLRETYCWLNSQYAEPWLRTHPYDQEEC